LQGRIVIDEDASFADFSIAVHQPDVKLDVSLKAVSPPSTDLGRLQRRIGNGYQVLRLRRAQPGFMS
jgi:hypothetical protein